MPESAAPAAPEPHRAFGVRTSRLRAVGVLSVAGLVAIGATACAAGDADGDAQVGEGSADGEETGLVIVASIDVYEDLVRAVVGDTAEVEAMVDNPAMDPHSYEATPQDRLRVEQADVLIANGGGYDPFLTRLASSADKEADVYQVIEGENEHADGSEGPYENEHIWYDLSAMSGFVEDFAEHMGDLVPENAELYAQNAADMAGEIDELDERNRAIEADGLSFLATEPVSQFLLLDAGFEDLTEESFIAAIEHGDDVSPRLYQDALDTVAGDEIDLLAYNEQTETNQSQQIRVAAEDAGVPVLEFIETFPDDVDAYLDWMEHNITQVEDMVEARSG